MNVILQFHVDFHQLLLLLVINVFQTYKNFLLMDANSLYLAVILHQLVKILLQSLEVIMSLEMNMVELIVFLLPGLRFPNRLLNINTCVATLLWESVRMKFTLLKWGLGSPPGLPKLQSSIPGVKTPCIGVLFISLKNYRSVDVENGLAWAIWTSVTQVMAKRRAGSQTNSLAPDH